MTLLRRLYRNIPIVRELTRQNEFLESSIRRIEGDLAFLAFHLNRIALAELNRENAELLASERCRDPRRLALYERKVFSQNGEDGILAEIFSRLGSTSRLFVEIGTGDGLENNTVFLLMQGWKGLWIEGDQEACDKILHEFSKPIDSNLLRLKNSLVTAENVTTIFEELNVPIEFDLLSIDIDRNTYYVWEALGAYKPRVAVIEYNAQLPPQLDWKVEYQPESVWNGTMYYGSSLKALQTLGEEKGYSLVGCDLHGVNAFFVREDLCGDLFVRPFSSENHYEPPRHWLIRQEGHPPSFTG